jgi:hypothetical protein
MERLTFLGGPSRAAPNEWFEATVVRREMRMTPKLALLLLGTILSGCMLNGIDEVRLTRKMTPRGDEAFAIFGVSVRVKQQTKIVQLNDQLVQVPWQPIAKPKFRMIIGEYDFSLHEAKGGCFVFNRMQAEVDANPMPIHSSPAPAQYFSFRVKPGSYVYHGLSSGQAEEPYGFHVPKGEVVYLGEFIYHDPRRVTLHRNLADAKTKLAGLNQSLVDRLVEAEMFTAATFGMFLCAP